jgi:hypothetical protein
MSTYIINPVELRMKEDARGTLYASIVAMGMRATDLAVQLRQKLEEEIADLLEAYGEDELTNDIRYRRLQEEQYQIALRFDAIPKPTFLAMKERLEGKLTYRIPEPHSPLPVTKP